MYQTVPFHHISPVNRREEQLRNHNKSGVQLITKKNNKKKIQFYIAWRGGTLKGTGCFFEFCFSCCYLLYYCFFFPPNPPHVHLPETERIPLRHRLSYQCRYIVRQGRFSLRFFFFFKKFILFFCLNFFFGRFRISPPFEDDCKIQFYISCENNDTYNTNER